MFLLSLTELQLFCDNTKKEKVKKMKRKGGKRISLDELIKV